MKSLTRVLDMKFDFANMQTKPQKKVYLIWSSPGADSIIFIEYWDHLQI